MKDRWICRLCEATGNDGRPGWTRHYNARHHDLEAERGRR